MYANLEYCTCKTTLRSDENECENCGKTRLAEEIDLTKQPRGKHAKTKDEPIYAEVVEQQEKLEKINIISELTDGILRLKNEFEENDQKILLWPSSLDQAVKELQENPSGGLQIIINSGNTARSARTGEGASTDNQYEEPVNIETNRMADELKEFSGLQRSVGLFKGGKDEDVEAYFRKLERWFTLCGWDAPKKARTISILLEGKAAHMYEALEANTRADYALAKEEIIKTFRTNQSHLMRWNNINRLRMETGQSVSDFYHQI